MKKITFLAIAIVAISAASCKKNYTCECKWTDDNTVAGSYTYKNTKAKAKTACEANNVNGSITCSIK